MIAYLKGKILGLNADNVVLDVNGVGYETHCSLNTIRDLEGFSEVELHIYTHVREDAIILYGFSNLTEKELFLSLIKVNGVGPKLAQNLLSGATVNEIVQMIESEDVKGLTKLPKVGKKIAEQLILTLRGKLVSKSEEKQIIQGNKKEIYSALVNLGFKDNDVQKVVKEFAETIDFEEGVRRGLQTLSGQ